MIKFCDVLLFQLILLFISIILHVTWKIIICLGNRLSEAAKNVAETLGGDTEKTEKELLDLYLSSIPKENEAADTAQQEKGTVEENVVPKPDIKSV